MRAGKMCWQKHCGACHVLQTSHYCIPVFVIIFKMVCCTHPNLAGYKALHLWTLHILSIALDVIQLSSRLESNDSQNFKMTKQFCSDVSGFALHRQCRPIELCYLYPQSYYACATITSLLYVEKKFYLQHLFVCHRIALLKSCDRNF